MNVNGVHWNTGLAVCHASLGGLKQFESRLIDEPWWRYVAGWRREGVGRLRVLIIAIIESVFR